MSSNCLSPPSARAELVTSFSSATSNPSPFLLLSASAREEFENTKDPMAAYDSVILGLDPESLSYNPLNKAFRILKGEPLDSEHTQAGKSPSLIAPHASLFQQSPATSELPEGLSLGIGPFVRALELASGVEPELVGKPTRRFFELATGKVEEIYGKIDGQVAVIGDDVKNDLGEGAKELGLKRILGKLCCRAPWLWLWMKAYDSANGQVPLWG